MQDLPYEIEFQLVLQLNMFDMCQYARTCRTSNRIWNSDLFWKTRLVTDFSSRYFEGFPKIGRTDLGKSIAGDGFPNIGETKENRNTYITHFLKVKDKIKVLKDAIPLNFQDYLMVSSAFSIYGYDRSWDNMFEQKNRMMNFIETHQNCVLELTESQIELIKRHTKIRRLLSLSSPDAKRKVLLMSEKEICALIFELDYGQLVFLQRKLSEKDCLSLGNKLKPIIKKIKDAQLYSS